MLFDRAIALEERQRDLVRLALVGGLILRQLTRRSPARHRRLQVAGQRAAVPEPVTIPLLCIDVLRLVYLGLLFALGHDGGAVLDFEPLRRLGQLV